MTDKTHNPAPAPPPALLPAPMAVKDLEIYESQAVPASGGRWSHAAWDTVTVVVPDHWLPALVNDDTSGMDADDEVSFERWVQDAYAQHGAFVVGDVTDTFFARYHDAEPYGVLACLCCEVQLHFATAP
jgi:hypothetical protein